jgi:hypothetical protein
MFIGLQKPLLFDYLDVGEVPRVGCLGFIAGYRHTQTWRSKLGQIPRLDTVGGLGPSNLPL